MGNITTVLRQIKEEREIFKKKSGSMRKCPAEYIEEDPKINDEEEIKKLTETFIRECNEFERLIDNVKNNISEEVKEQFRNLDKDRNQGMKDSIDNMLDLVKKMKLENLIKYPRTIIDVINREIPDHNSITCEQIQLFILQSYLETSLIASEK